MTADKLYYTAYKTFLINVTRVTFIILPVLTKYKAHIPLSFHNNQYHKIFPVSLAYENYNQQFKRNGVYIILSVEVNITNGDFEKIHQKLKELKLQFMSLNHKYK